MTYLDLNHAAIDYLTLTSFEPEFRLHWNRVLDQIKPLRKTDTRSQQYQGEMTYYPAGSVFQGDALQKGLDHYVVKISGGLAEEMRETAFRQQKAHLCRATRVDLQVTIAYPKDWSQIDLLQRIHDSGKIPGWRSSDDQKAGRLESVYIGSWHSDRFATVYPKVTRGNTKLLRFECRYKKDRANSLLRMLAAGERPDNFLRHELINTIKDKPLRAVFEPALIGTGVANPKIKLKQKEDKTADWLVEQVLPTFTRMIADHDSDGRVLDAYKKAIERQENYG